MIDGREWGGGGSTLVEGVKPIAASRSGGSRCDILPKIRTDGKLPPLRGRKRGISFPQGTIFEGDET